jgi:two-component sensor histidine kinase
MALVVRDTGVGFPVDMDFRHTDSLGLQLVCLLTEQLGGTIELDRASGTQWTLKFLLSNL